ncbi:MAG: patatin-like phospholipase family protein [Clostridia bacterium]|nr:patatin-like phospholipase family protein [Clostridia bacterium]
MIYKDGVAIVLAGGGARGSYQVGAMKALRELGVGYSIVTGTSVGALNGAVMTLENGVELAQEMWMHITTESVLDCSVEGDMSDPAAKNAALRVFVAKAIKDGSIDQSPLRELLMRVVDVDGVYESPIDFGLVTVHYPSLEPVCLFKGDIPRDKLIDYMMASSACFPGMKTYTDGGYYDNMPINMALDRGATEIIAINLHSIGVSRSVKRQDVKLTVIEPHEDLGMILIFSPEVARRNIAIGYNDAMKAYGRYDGWTYTFEKGSFEGGKEAFVELCERLARLALPRNAAGDAFLDFIALRFIKHMVKTTSAKYVHRGWIHVAADMAGRMFGLETAHVYTEREFAQEIKLRLLATESPAKAGDLVEAAKSIGDKAMLTRLFYDELRRGLDVGRLSAQVSLAAGAVMTQLLAAAFCVLIDERYAPQL